MRWMGAPWRQWPPTGEERKSWGKWWKKMMETAGTSHQHPIECRHFSILLLVPFLVQITFNEISFISAPQWSIFVKLIWIFGPSSFGIVWISPWNSHGNERQASANWCHSFGTFPPEKKKNIQIIWQRSRTAGTHLSPAAAWLTRQSGFH